MDFKTGAQQDSRYLAAIFNEKGAGVRWRCSYTLVTMHDTTVTTFQGFTFGTNPINPCIYP